MIDHHSLLCFFLQNIPRVPAEFNISKFVICLILGNSGIFDKVISGFLSVFFLSSYRFFYYWYFCRNRCLSLAIFLRCKYTQVFIFNMWQKKIYSNDSLYFKQLSHQNLKKTFYTLFFFVFWSFCLFLQLSAVILISSSSLKKILSPITSKIEEILGQKMTAINTKVYSYCWSLIVRFFFYFFFFEDEYN